MTPINFCYWLHGFFELSNSNTLSEEQVKEIRNHLRLIFSVPTLLPPNTISDDTKEKLKKAIEDHYKENKSIPFNNYLIHSPSNSNDPPIYC